MGKVCPFCVGYLLLSPLRRLFQNPTEILSPFMREGITALDVGCGMGYFSLSMAELVGPEGSVICVDLQERMINTLARRAAKRGLSDRIQVRVCSEKSLGIDDLRRRIDFALAFALVHEVPDPAAFFPQLHAVLKPGAAVLMAEPKGRVSVEDFRHETALAEQSGLTVIGEPRITRTRSVMLKK